MAIFKCKMCGATLKVPKDTYVLECEYCGTEQTIPRIETKTIEGLYERAYKYFSINDYDKALEIYNQILNENPSDPEAYWSLVLCEYGIEYVVDPRTKRRVATVNRAQYDSIYDNDNYKKALKYATDEQKDVYTNEAKYIDNIQRRILEISKKEKPYDVFICYKETNDRGGRTEDSVLAMDIYNELTREGLKVFFSRITLEDKLGSEYEPYIFAAINSAKVMICVGTSAKNFNSPWVKNEWSRYLTRMSRDNCCSLVPVYKKISPYELPSEFNKLQSQDMSKIGAMQDLIYGVKKLVSGKSFKTQNNKIIGKSSSFNFNRKNVLVIVAIFVVIVIFFGVFSIFKNSRNWRTENGYKVYYKDKDTKIVNQWYEIDGNKYYFDKYGYMQTSQWITTDNNQYYVDKDGKMLVDTITPDGYCVDIDGKYVKSGLINSKNGNIKYFADGKYIIDNDVKINNSTYHFDKDGYMVTNNWVENNGNKYYFGEDGKMIVNGWANIENKKYYLSANGILLINTETPDGNWVGEDGAYDEDLTIKHMSDFKNRLKNASIGQYVKFGKYEQDNNISNGKEDIEWRVLAKENGRILLVSKYILDVIKQYGSKKCYWHNSDVRNWLNNTFYNKAFTSSEKKIINNSLLKNEIVGFNTVEDMYKDYSGKTMRSILKHINKYNDETNDKIFLLSVQEVERYFSSKIDRLAEGTLYAKLGGESGQRLYIENDFEKYSSYHLRTICDSWSSDFNSPTYCITFKFSANDEVGDFEVNGMPTGSAAIRPAIWINID